MKKSEHDYYSAIGNWSFSDINYKSKTLTNWIYESEVQKHIKKNSKVLDLGTAAGEKVLKYYPECREILATDFSETMIKNANKNLKVSGRKNITFRVMDNLNMDVNKNYYDVVVARHTPTDPKQIYEVLKPNGYLIIRGVDKYDCFELEKTFNKPQNNNKPISIIDYENVLEAGFKDVELVPIHTREYYQTKEDLLKLLLKVPIINNFSNEKIDIEVLDKYIERNTYSKGIRLVRRYYGITARK